jgi:hypothetical protein
MEVWPFKTDPVTLLTAPVPVKGRVSGILLSLVKQNHGHVDTACGKYDLAAGGGGLNSFDSAHSIVSLHRMN